MQRKAKPMQCKSKQSKARATHRNVKQSKATQSNARQTEHNQITTIATQRNATQATKQRNARAKPEQIKATRSQSKANAKPKQGNAKESKAKPTQRKGKATSEESNATHGNVKQRSVKPCAHDPSRSRTRSCACSLTEPLTRSSAYPPPARLATRPLTLQVDSL